MERTVPDAGEGVRQSNARYARAILKRITPDARDAVGYRDARKKGIIKRTGPDARDAGGDGESTSYACRALDEGGLSFIIYNAI